MGLSQSTTGKQKKEKVERLFRQNVRSSRSRSSDCRNDRPPRPVEGSLSVRLPRDRCRTQEDGVNGSISGLSQDEKRMIEVCWSKCTQKQLKRCAMNIFADILRQDESLLKLFNLDSVPSNRLRDHDYFKSHASNFAIVLNLVITNMLDNFEQACQALQTLGHQHVALRARGFQTSYWDIFTDCFERNRPLTFRKDVGKEAWSRMILFILGQMKIGYHRGIAGISNQETDRQAIY